MIDTGFACGTYENLAWTVTLCLLCSSISGLFLVMWSTFALYLSVCSPWKQQVLLSCLLFVPSYAFQHDHAERQTLRHIISAGIASTDYGHLPSRSNLSGISSTSFSRCIPIVVYILPLHPLLRLLFSVMVHLFVLPRRVLWALPSAWGGVVLTEVTHVP